MTARWTSCVAALLLASGAARADESGVSFWLPGQMGSLAAAPSDPGWSLPVAYIYTSVEADASRSFPLAGRITLGLDSKVDLFLFSPTYTFAQPVAGGQAAVGISFGGGRVKTSINGTLSGPGGSTVSGSETDTLWGVADLYPTASLKWTRGVHNTMVYTMGGVPVGSYSPGRLSNMGINHYALDAGAGYTYLDTKTGYEFSAVAGVTYNWENKDTQYRSGNDGHIDWAASYFFRPTTHAGVAGYIFHQLTGDSGAGAKLGDFKSRVSGIGPQFGHTFEAGGRQYYFNTKAYWEFDAKNRPEGWNFWLSLAIPLGGK